MRARRNVHLQRVKAEREFVNRSRCFARQNPKKLLFFEVDSMDSSKTLLPHFNRISKSVNKELLIKYHITCVKFDGSRPDDVYFYTNVLPHDSQTTITIIWKTLVKVKPSSLTPSLQAATCSYLNPRALLQELNTFGRLPPSIHIQLDNTCRENKNKWVLAFCQWVVKMGLTKVIRLSFLPVG